MRTVSYACTNFGGCDKVNVDDEENLARKFGIMSIPCLYFFKDGEVVGKQVGLLPKDALLKKIEEYL